MIRNVIKLLIGMAIGAAIGYAARDFQLFEESLRK
jgi:hypothetical protein